jgi:hypothetical protein
MNASIVQNFEFILKKKLWNNFKDFNSRFESNFIVGTFKNVEFSYLKTNVVLVLAEPRD